MLNKLHQAMTQVLAGLRAHDEKTTALSEARRAPSLKGVRREVLAKMPKPKDGEPRGRNT